MEGARRILEALGKRGHEAYLIGGIVRDMLLGRVCHDIDIATSAGVQEIIETARVHGWQTVEVGRAFGCIVLVIGERSYEVTTFRSERYGEDSHRPTEVVCGVSLAEDVLRRDFTINGMAMTAEGKVIDMVGGRQDLAAKVMRCIGDGRRRFAEDALRAFRACRFVAQLGFDLDDAVLPAIRANLDRMQGLSMERVRTEIEKTLLAPYSASGLDAMMRGGLLASSASVRVKGEVKAVAILPELVHLVGLRQNPRYHAHDAWGHTLAVVDALPSELTVRWAGLLHDVAKGLDGIRAEKDGQPTDHGHAERGAQMAKEILQRLGYASAFADRVAWLVREHMGCVPLGDKGALRWLKKRASEWRTKEDLIGALGQLRDLLRADGIGTGREQACGREMLFDEIFRKAQDTVLYADELAIGGRELIAIVGQGRAVGAMLTDLLARVTAGELVNERDVLRIAAQKSHDKRLCKGRASKEK